MGDRNWDAMRRALLLLQRLRRGPADKAQLIEAVRHALPDAYRAGGKSAARKFERDLENVRLRLEADVLWHAGLQQYVLVEAGPFAQSELPPDAIEGLAFLRDSFTTSEEIQAVIRPLLEWVEQAVPPKQLRRMTHQQTPILLNLSKISEAEIQPVVWEKVIYAIRHRRIIEFDYASPIHERSEPRRHRVEPYEHYFRNGHFYLKAYCLRWVAPNGYENGRFWANPYRLDYILPADIQLHNQFVRREQRPALQRVWYKLSPQIVRGGISQYFQRMEVGEADEGGWVEVRGWTDNEFEAFRILLAYGDQCVVLGPPTLVERIKRVVHQMASSYGKTNELSHPQ